MTDELFLAGFRIQSFHVPGRAIIAWYLSLRADDRHTKSVMAFG